ncbi:MAG: methionine adenosyltransferase [Candidatus Freyarchaeum deiterrae]
MNLEVSKAQGLPPSHLPMEMVERKGKGHPDSICDRASEELSISLSEYYLENFGRVLHHNVDKCVLVGGQSNARLGGGDILEPIYLLLVGRATVQVGHDSSKKVPVGKFAVGHTKEWIAETLPHLDVNCDLIVDYKIKPGSVDLVGNFDQTPEIPRANDTSFGVSFAPFTETETLVYQTEKTLNSPECKQKCPAVGEDIKVMGVRRNNTINLTVATAIISSETPDKDSYISVKDEIKEWALNLASKITDMDVNVYVNTADVIKNDLMYLTVTGTSAEHGDDGQVGRGNRANGLITPYRPMTLEATAGKNPVTHVGKTYNTAARRIADTLVKEEPKVENVSVYIVSQIGAPITEPQGINLELNMEGSINAVKDTAEAIAEEVMQDMPNIWKGFMQREYELF